MQAVYGIPVKPELGTLRACLKEAASAFAGAGGSFTPTGITKQGVSLVDQRFGLFPANAAVSNRDAIREFTPRRNGLVARHQVALKHQSNERPLACNTLP